jgi:thiamine biosynthesis lipoprotein
MSTLLNFAGELWAASGGLFDITSGVLRKAWDFQRGGNASPTQLAECLPKVGWDLVEYKNDSVYLPLQGMQIDLGGIVKEYAADCVAASIREAGITSALIDLAGDVVVIGRQGNGKPWQIGIRDPDSSSGSLLTLSLQDAAVATSGNYARTIKHNGLALSHFLNPRTGWPVNGPITVSVLDQRCLTAGAIATVACLKTDSHAQAWLEEAGLPWLMMKSCGTLIDTLTNPVSQRESLTSLQTLQLSH